MLFMELYLSYLMKVRAIAIVMGTFLSVPGVIYLSYRNVQEF